jgi:transposase
MIGVMKRHAIQVLRAAGHTYEDIAKRLEVSERSARSVAHEPAVEALVEKPDVAKKAIGRPSTAEPFRKHVETILTGDRKLPTVEVLRLVREKGYLGGKSAIYELVRLLRPPKTPPPMVRFEAVPGEFSQHDFGSVTVQYVSGKSERIHFFASRIKYSRTADVLIVPDEQVESVVRGLIHSFEVFGGVPLSCVFDNPKTVVYSHKKRDWNPTFGQAALDFRFAPELCTPRRANEKGAVENLVGWVKSSFFKVRRFHDREDLLRQLAEWLREVNEERPSRATNEIPKVRLAVERERLRPLRMKASEYALRFPVFVGPTARVLHRGIRYVMPPDCIGFAGTLYLYPDKVRIVAGKYERTHPRFPETGDTSWCAGDRAAMLAAVSGERGKLYERRQQLLDLGAPAEEYITELVYRHRHTWKGDVEALHDLLVGVGPSKMLNAMRVALRERNFNVARIEEIAA